MVWLGLGQEGEKSTYTQQQHLEALLTRGHQQRQVGQGRFEVVPAEGLVLEELSPLGPFRQAGLFLEEKVQARVDDAPGHETVVFGGKVYFAALVVEVVGGDEGADGCEAHERHICRGVLVRV